MSLNAILDGELMTMFEEAPFEILDGDTSSSTFIQGGEAKKTNCDLFLTDYLLNFNDELDHAYCSGVEDSDEENDVPLASLRKKLTNTDSTKCKKTVPKKPSRSTKPAKAVESQDVTEKKEARKRYDRERAVKYRAKKHQETKQMETECIELRSENKALQRQNEQLTKKVASLEKEVDYLEDVICNQSALSAILNTLTKHTGITFSGNPLQCLSRKRKSVEETEERSRTETAKKFRDAGVCIHLTPEQLTVEVCSICHQKAHNLKK